MRAQRPKVSTVLMTYRSAVFSSVSNRTTIFSILRYLIVQYIEMVEWTTCGGVKKAKINYMSQELLDIHLEIKEENGFLYRDNI